MFKCKGLPFKAQLSACWALLFHLHVFNDLSDLICISHLMLHLIVSSETVAKTGMILLVGEITSRAVVDYQKIVRDTIRVIGYDDSSKGTVIWQKRSNNLNFFVCVCLFVCSVPYMHSVHIDIKDSLWWKSSCRFFVLFCFYFKVHMMFFIFCKTYHVK